MQINLVSLSAGVLFGSALAVQSWHRFFHSASYFQYERLPFYVTGLLIIILHFLVDRSKAHVFSIGVMAGVVAIALGRLLFNYLEDPKLFLTYEVSFAWYGFTVLSLLGSGLAYVANRRGDNPGAEFSNSLLRYSFIFIFFWSIIAITVRVAGFSSYSIIGEFLSQIHYAISVFFIQCLFGFLLLKLLGILRSRFG